jgi:hypothetical protein
MKKRSPSQFAFFNLRVLIGLFIILAGASLALLGSGTSSASLSFAKAQMKKRAAMGAIDLSMLPAGFDCSKVQELGIDKQENLHAGMIMIACGLADGGSAPHVSALSRLIQKLLAP